MSSDEQRWQIQLYLLIMLANKLNRIGNARVIHWIVILGRGTQTHDSRVISSLNFILALFINVTSTLAEVKESKNENLIKVALVVIQLGYSSECFALGVIFKQFRHACLKMPC